MIIKNQTTDKWIEFLGNQNKQLNHLKLHVESLSNEHFLSIPENLPNLETEDIRDHRFSTMFEA